MSETKTVLLLVPVEVAADGRHCGGECPLRMYHELSDRFSCRGWGSRLASDEKGEG